MKYTIGLNLGIASIGWAVYDMDSNNLIQCGTRLFDAAEHPKTHAPLALPRRLARGQRRRIRRRSYRMKAIKKLLIESKLITELKLDGLFNNTNKTKTGSSHYDAYELRAIAIEDILSNDKLCQVLIHLAKHRGFKSNRKNDKSVDGVINDSLIANKKLLQESNYRTIGEMLHKHDEFKYNKRNKFSEYRIMLSRDDIENEAHIILHKQLELGNLVITPEFIQRYMTIFNWQKSFDWNNDIYDMVGTCYFEREEKRAPKACFSSEKFVALSKLNNILIRNIALGTERKLSVDEINQVISHVLAKTVKNTPKITFGNLRKLIELSDDDRFNYVKYKSNQDFLEQEKAEAIRELSFSSTHELKNHIVNSIGHVTWDILLSNTQLLDKIAIDLTYNKTDDKIIEALNQTFKSVTNNFSVDTQKQIIQTIIDHGIGFDKNINLSLKFLYKILPSLESGKRYDEACSIAGYDHSIQHNVKHVRLPSIQSLGLDQELTNPVVTRAISQTRKVINAIIDKYGSPYQINVELSRDVGKSAKVRNEISGKQRKKQIVNEEYIKTFLEYFGRTPRKDELTKYKLWKQQSGKCIYSGNVINLSEIMSGTNQTQINYIIPHSRSFDDSLSNKVLCSTHESQRKGNQIPFEYICENGHNPDAWHNFMERCENLNKTNYMHGFSYTKLDLLLLKNFNQEGFIERNINDTRYISRFILNYLQNHLQFAERTNKLPVRALTGQATAFIRNHWGLNKSRDTDDRHSAQDACVIAAINQKMISNVTKYMQAKELGYEHGVVQTDLETGEVLDKFPMPNINYRNQIINNVQNVFVSRAAKRKISGKIHDDTIRSRKYVDNPIPEYNDGKPFSTVNKPLAESGIKVDDTGNITALSPTYKQHNTGIYKALVERLEQYDNDTKKAFSTPLYAPRKDGTPSNTLVKTVKIMQMQNTGVEVNHGIADNGRMVRIDVFNKDDKNYIIPIYLSDTIKQSLPNRVITSGKHESEWQLIDADFKFLYSYYPNDLIKVTTKKETYFGYYGGTDRTSGGINILAHDGSKLFRGIGIKINAVVEKYQVDVLGNYQKVNKETRLSFNL